MVLFSFGSLRYCRKVDPLILETLESLFTFLCCLETCIAFSIHALCPYLYLGGLVTLEFLTVNQLFLQEVTRSRQNFDARRQSTPSFHSSLDMSSRSADIPSRSRKMRLTTIRVNITLFGFLLLLDANISYLI
jgi:hypothetical protein